MAVDQTYRTGRGHVYVRETAPGCIVVSFYPRSEHDELWPGTIQVADDIDGFPKQAALDGDDSVVAEFVAEHAAWR